MAFYGVCFQRKDLFQLSFVERVQRAEVHLHGKDLLESSYINTGGARSLGWKCWSFFRWIWALAWQVCIALHCVNLGESLRHSPGRQNGQLHSVHITAHAENVVLCIVRFAFCSTGYSEARLSVWVLLLYYTATVQATAFTLE